MRTGISADYWKVVVEMERIIYSTKVEHILCKSHVLNEVCGVK